MARQRSRGWWCSRKPKPSKPAGRSPPSRFDSEITPRRQPRRGVFVCRSKWFCNGGSLPAASKQPRRKISGWVAGGHARLWQPRQGRHGKVAPGATREIKALRPEPRQGWKKGGSGPGGNPAGATWPDTRSSPSRPRRLLCPPLPGFWRPSLQTPGCTRGYFPVSPLPGLQTRVPPPATHPEVSLRRCLERVAGASARLCLFGYYAGTDIFLKIYLFAVGNFG